MRWGRGFSASSGGSKPTRIDEKAAVLLVLNSIVETGIELDQLALSVQVVQLMPGPAGVGTLDKRPDAIYLVTASTEKAVRVTIIKSDGKVLYSRDYPKDWLRFGLLEHYDAVDRLHRPLIANVRNAVIERRSCYEPR